MTLDEFLSICELNAINLTLIYSASANIFDIETHSPNIWLNYHEPRCRTDDLAGFLERWNESIRIKFNQLQENANESRNDRRPR